MRSVDPGILPHSVCFSFTPPEIAKELLFYPTWCGHYYCTSNYFMKRESYPPLLVVFVREGVFRVEYRGEQKLAKQGDVLLLDCTEPHYYHAEDGLEFVYMHFDGSNSHQLCQHVIDRRGWLLQRNSNILIGKLLYDMVEFYDHDQVETPFESSMRIYRLFELLLAPKRKEKAQNNPIDDAIQYIRKNVGEQISLDMLAKIANLSPYYFSHSFKRQTGFSPKEYIINTRLDRAKTLLATTTQPISEIAFEVGYLSSGSLINLFVDRVGMSPKQYRKTHQSHS